ncbi:hypothetical protein IL306_006826 [Fusarium sp. DS 682]|nr:hypothetical protein IL306_006826 [Fusarium sp. DS 682]
MAVACSIGYAASQRRPTGLTAEQSAAIDNDPEIQRLLRKRQRCNVPETRKRITKTLQSLRAKLRREKKNDYRSGWTRKQAVTDIERQLAGHTFEESPSGGDLTQNQNPVQKLLFQALTAPEPSTLEAEYRRRDNAVLAVMAYCNVQEPPSLRTKKASKISKGSDLRDADETQANAHIGTAITSVFIKGSEERSRRCFLCVGRATTLQPSDPAIERLTKPFYSAADLSKHFKRRHLSNLQPNEELYCRLCDEMLEHKMHLQNHAETVHGTVSHGG